MIYIANVSEDDLHDPMQNKHYQQITNYAKKEHVEVVNNFCTSRNGNCFTST
jgi:ribosome-binding ATPase YchF (GTP1/OBG family)